MTPQPPRSALMLLDDGVSRVVLKSIRIYGIRVPRGFVTDFASVPWFFRRVIDPARGKHVWAAILHDYLYENHEALGYTRQEADRIFLAAMRYYGTSKIQSRLGHWGVRLGGWYPWGQYESGALPKSIEKLASFGLTVSDLPYVITIKS